MAYQLTTEIPGEQATDCILVGLYDDQNMTPALEYLDKLSDGFIYRILRQGDIKGKIGQHLLLYQVPNVAAERVLIVGCGDQEQLTAKQYRGIMKAAIDAAQKTQCKQADCYLTELPIQQRELDWKLRQAVVVSEDTLYQFNQFKTKEGQTPPTLKHMQLATSKQADVKVLAHAIKQGQAIANGIKLTKKLGNLPANVCTPSYLAEQSTQLAEQFDALSCQVLTESDMRELKMGAILAVAKGSVQPPKLIVLEYSGAENANQKPYVLVGKGVTFDSGGLSLKPPKGMEQMKYDMCGAASVLGAMHAVATMQLPINVVAIVPSVENMPGGHATRPGDIITTMSGQTVEVLNTDAEGRLILCDALHYAAKYQPAAVIDVATLTGAVVVALGAHFSGMMGNNDSLLDALSQAGETADDPLWQLPLTDAYQKAMDSKVADICNISSTPGAGSITAGCFLARFCHEYAWAHLDIAGTAWDTGGKKIATGRPVAALIQYLLDRCS